MPQNTPRLLIRADGHVRCTGCSRAERQDTYLPRHLFTLNELDKAEGWEGGSSRLPTVLCKLCLDERNQRSKQSRLNAASPQYPEFPLYLAFVMGPRA